MEKILFISPSTLDRKSLILTLIVCVLPILMMGWLFFYRILQTNNTFSIVILGCTITLFLGIFISGVIITPYRYILTNSHLIIKRHYKDIVIPLQDIKLIQLMTPDDKKGLWKPFGAEGSYGLYGYWQTSKHKKLTVFARRYRPKKICICSR